MPTNPFERFADVTEVAGAVVTALRTRGDHLAVAEHTGGWLAQRIDALAAGLRVHEVRRGELVHIGAGSPVRTIIGCLAAWLVGATPVTGELPGPRIGVGPGDDDLVVAGGEPVQAEAAALVVAETLVGVVAHPWACLGRLALPEPAPRALHVVADWRVDAWLPLVLHGLLEGVPRIVVGTDVAGPAADPDAEQDAVLAAPAGRPVTVGWTGPVLGWGGADVGGAVDERHRHGYGDHAVIALTRPYGGRWRGVVPGRHRVCGAAGKPLPANAWGWLAVAGSAPAIGDTLAEALDAAARQDVRLTGHRARQRTDGSIEFEPGGYAAFRFAGRLFSSRLADAALTAAGLADTTLLARDPGTERERLVLFSAVPDTDSPLERARAALPSWAAPHGTVAVTRLPRHDDGTIDHAALHASALPDDWVLAHAEGVLSREGGEAVRLTARTRPVPGEPLVLSEGFLTRGPGYSGARAALVDGPHLDPPADDLVDRLRRAAGTDEGIVVVDGDGGQEWLPYRDLLVDASRMAAHLIERGVRPGDEVIVHAARPADLFGGLWACLLAGALAVPISPARPYDVDANPIWYLLGPDSMLTRRTVLTPQAQWAVTGPALAARGLHAEHLTMEVARTAAPLAAGETRPHHHAILLLTSGSTGAPKGVALSHRNLVALAEGIGAAFGFRDHEVSLNWLAIDHVGGLVQQHLRDTCLVNRQVHVDTDYILAEPTRLLDLLDRHGVTLSWQANFGFNLLNEREEEIRRGTWDLSAVTMWENGGEAVSHEGCQRFLELLRPHGLRGDVIKPVFGMTETSSAVIVAHNLVARHQDYVHWLADTAMDSPVARALPGEGTPFVEVGRPIAGVAMRVVDAAGQVCPEGVIGRIEVSGVQVMDGYHHNDAANAATFTDDGWLRMGDCGFIVDGSLVVTGREKDVLIVNGVNYAAQAVESAVENVADVRAGSVAAVSVRQAEAGTDDLVVFFASEDGRTADPLAIEAALTSEVNRRPAAVVELDPAAVPRTAIGKIRRQSLAKDFLAGRYSNEVVLRRGGGLGEPQRLPAWHFRPRWRRSAPPVASQPRVLWLGGRPPAAAPAVAVPGPPFAGFDDRGRAHYRADDPSDVAAVLAAAEARLGGLDAVVDAGFTLLPETADAEAASRALAEAGVRWRILGAAVQAVQGPPTVTFAVGAAWVVSGDDHLVVHGALPGVARTLAQEYPGLSIKVVDGADHDAVLAECGAARGEAEVAYRDGDRFVLHLEPLPVTEVPAVPRRVLREGGRYLVVGGLGGVGAHLCQHLLRRYRAHLVVVGRGDARGGGSRAQTLAYLTEWAAQVGGTVRYERADATDVSALRTVVERAEQEWGAAPDAVFDLAGEGSVVEQLDGAGGESVASRRAADRIRICHALDAVLGDRPTALVIFGSVNGLLGGTGFLEYAGACAYQAAFAERPGGRAGATVCLDWSMWRQVGMAAGTSSVVVELARRRGFARLTPAQGLASLHVALDAGLPRVVIGLVAEGVDVAPMLPFDALEPEVRAEGAADPDRVAELLGLPADRIVAVGRAGSAASVASQPRTRALLAVFRDVLGNPGMTADDGFFAMGGDSIRAIQVVNRAAAAGFRFSALDLFEHKTVAGLLANAIAEEAGPGEPAVDDASSTPVAVPPIVAWWLENGDDPDSRAHFTMSMRYRLAGDVTPPQVEAALLTLVERHEALRLRLLESGDGALLGVGESPAESLVFTAEVAATSPESARELENRLHREVDPVDGPIVRAAHVPDGDGGALLLLVVHHLAIDGVSWRILEDELAALLGDPGADPPPRTAGYLGWVRRLLAVADAADGTAMADRWLAGLGGPWATVPRPPTPLLEAGAEVVTRRLPVGALESLGESSVNELLLTAVGWNLASWLGGDRVALDVEGHGRLQQALPVDVSRSLGWFTAIAPVCLDLGGLQRPGDAVRSVRRVLTDLRGRDLEWGMLRHLGACPAGHPLRDLPARQVSYNYLGVLDGEPVGGTAFAAVPGSLDAQQGPSTVRRYLIDIAAAVSGGVIELSVKHSPEVHERTAVRRFLDGCVETLSALASGDAATAADDVDADELALALAQVSFDG